MITKNELTLRGSFYVKQKSVEIYVTHIIQLIIYLSSVNNSLKALKNPQMAVSASIFHLLARKSFYKSSNKPKMLVNYFFQYL
jgi:hypothetical protein